MKNESITKDWKADIGKFFGENKIFRMELLNKNLSETTKEWTEHLEEFDNIRTSRDVNLLDTEFNNYHSMTVIIKVRSKFIEYPAFIITIGYKTNDDHTETVLRVKYTNNINTGNFFKNNSKDEDKWNHIFVVEEIKGEQIFDHDFILSKLNDLLKYWINKNNIQN